MVLQILLQPACVSCQRVDLEANPFPHPFTKLTLTCSYQGLEALACIDPSTERHHDTPIASTTGTSPKGMAARHQKKDMLRSETTCSHANQAASRKHYPQQGCTWTSEDEVMLETAFQEAQAWRPASLQPSSDNPCDRRQKGRCARETVLTTQPRNIPSLLHLCAEQHDTLPAGTPERRLNK